MKVSDILTLVAVLTAGASAYFAYDSWEKYAGKPFDEAARRPAKFRYIKNASTRAPLMPTRFNRQDEKKVEEVALAKEQATLADLTQQRDTLRDENAVLSEEILAATTKKQDLQDKIRELNRTMNDNQERIRQLEEATAVTGNPEDLKMTVKDNIRRLNEANTALANEKQTLEAALQHKADLEQTLAAARRKESMQQAGEMEPDFKTTVREVFGRWGFVVINGGGSRGVNARTKLDVMRGGTKIAELQVTTVEPGVSVCAVVPGTMAADMAIAPGDQVVVAPIKAAAPDVMEQPAPMPVANPAPAAPAAAPAAADPFGAPAGPETLPEAAPAEPAGF